VTGRKAAACAKYFPKTQDIEDGFADLRKIANNIYGIVIVRDGKVVIMAYADPPDSYPHMVKL
jgi:hypothetical protein